MVSRKIISSCFDLNSPLVFVCIVLHDMEQIGKSKSLYEVLGLSSDCTTDEVRKAYRRVSRFVHPDKAGTESHSSFLRVSYARDVLINTRLRRAYDWHGETVLPSNTDDAGSTELADMVFHAFLSALGPRRNAHRDWMVLPMWFLFLIYISLSATPPSSPHTLKVYYCKSMTVQDAYYGYLAKQGKTASLNTYEIPNFSLEPNPIHDFTHKIVEPRTKQTFFGKKNLVIDPANSEALYFYVRYVTKSRIKRS